MHLSFRTEATFGPLSMRMTTFLPSISIGITMVEKLPCFADYNSERDEGAQICIGTYASDEDETKYYAPYMAERNNEP